MGTQILNHRTENLKTLKEQNYRLLKQDIKEKRSKPRGFPVFAGLCTDTRCNLKCVMCVQRTANVNIDPVKEEYLVKFADQVFPTATCFQLNCAGEPLMSRTFDLELDLAQKYRVKLEVITNGTMLNSKPGRFERLVSNASLIAVSIDSPFKKTYESIRKGADFDTVLDNLQKVQEYRLQLPSDARPAFHLVMILMKRNLDQVLDMVKFAKDMGADHLGLSHLVVHNEEMQKETLLDHKKETNRILTKAAKLSESLQLSIGMPELFDTESISQRILGPFSKKKTVVNPKKNHEHCFFLWDRVYLDPDARIVPCCHPAHPTTGSLEQSDFKDIWNGEKYQTMRETFTGGPAHPLCGPCANEGYLANL